MADGPAGVSFDGRFSVLAGVGFFVVDHARKAEVPSEVKVVRKLTWSSIFPQAPK